MTNMRIRKAVWYRRYLIEVWKCLGEVEVVWLVKLFNVILRSGRITNIQQVEKEYPDSNI